MAPPRGGERGRPPSQWFFDHFSKLPRTAEFFSGGGGVTSDAFGNVIFVTKCLAPSRVQGVG